MHEGGISTTNFNKSINEYKTVLIIIDFNKLKIYLAYFIKKVIFLLNKIRIYGNFLKLFFLYCYNFVMSYIPNYIIAYIPFYSIRHFYYRKILRIKLGRYSSIHMGVFINKNNIVIGENCAINRKCYLDGRVEYI
jgi:maltose O-acetyltransferase